jgi:gas vesicle protein
MAERSDEIRGQIADTRERMGDTVDALSYKADVPTRTKDWVSDKKDTVMSKVGGATSAVSDGTPDGEQVKRQAGRMKALAERNPAGLAIGGVAVGFLVGLLLPSTQMEDERLGEAADQVKSRAADAASEAVDRGKQVAQEAAQSAADTARESGREQSGELTSSLQDKARNTLGSDEPSAEDYPASDQTK